MIFRKILCLSSLGLILASYAQAQVYDYSYQGNTGHAGVQFDLNQNMNQGEYVKDGTKSAFAPFWRGGIYIKQQFSPRLYFKGTIMFGNGNFSYRYPRKALPTSDTTWPNFDKGRRGISLPMLEPELAFGYLFRIKSKHQIDLRLGVSAPVYLTKYSNVFDSVYSSTTLLGNDRINIATIDQVQVNRTGNQWGVVNGTLYLGYKKIHYNDVSDRLGIGLTVGYTLYDKRAGQTNFQAYNLTYPDRIIDHSHLLTYFSWGLRLEYDIF